MNTQSHATLKTTPYEVVFGQKPSSEPVQDLIITEEITDEEHNDSNISGDDEYQILNVSCGDDCKTPSSQSEFEGTYVSI